MTLLDYEVWFHGDKLNFIVLKLLKSIQLIEYYSQNIEPQQFMYRSNIATSCTVYNCLKHKL